MQVIAGAGVTLAALQEHARAAGLDVALDLAARDSATVGGLVATDAGGARALRYGTARARVVGMQAVLGSGAVVDRLSGLLKDNAGYNLPALLVGSEGTLGVTTAVRWQLVPRLPARVAALVPLPSIEAASVLLTQLRTRLSSLEAADFFLDDGFQLVLDHLRMASPVRNRAAVYLLIECAGRTDPFQELAEVLEADGADDALIATDTASRKRLWRLREAHPDAIAASGIPHKLDVGVPLHSLSEFLQRVPSEVGRVSPGAKAVIFGHLGDGNVHVNVLGPQPSDEAVDESVLLLAVSCGGTISAEHGVGTAKTRWLGLIRSPDEIAAMGAIKHALDPRGLLNPGVILPAESIS